MNVVCIVGDPSSSRSVGNDKMCDYSIIGVMGIPLRTLSSALVT